VFVENKPLSSMRNSPRVSIGLPIEKNKPYFKEVFKDFMGRSSPAASKYSPRDELTHPKDPSFSLSKFKRFYKPSSVVDLHAQIPTQYSKDPLLKVPTYDLMGLGKRFTYKMNKEDETTPGPGMYDNTDTTSIRNYISNSVKSGSNSRLAFGVSREQNDKLQLWGQERHFLGREGAEPGAYEQNFGTVSAKSQNKRLTLSKNDRGLLPLDPER
jgi:hypothetical protein